MSTIASPLQRRSSISAEQRTRAVAHVTRSIARYERELADRVPVTDAVIAHRAIISGQLVDLRHRLEQLRGAA